MLSIAHPGPGAALGAASAKPMAGARLSGFSGLMEGTPAKPDFGESGGLSGERACRGVLRKYTAYDRSHAPPTPLTLGSALRHHS
jgi:hypothetical protein